MIAGKPFRERQGNWTESHVSHKITIHAMTRRAARRWVPVVKRVPRYPSLPLIAGVLP
ncbi:hypothetical protein RADP37_05537 [Roseomonas mucosa]|uniref:Uncharacterized protein n=1 Tax=Roseomonas mucosa TaxID=207340 RepID=A0A4Y1MU05_9PROT|nr:hypothetical protein RADP37_05537 [Roseomonas mucosa]